MASTDGERLWQGALAGIGATLASGAISLVMLLAHLWPSDRPLSVAVVQAVFGRMGTVASPAELYLLAGAGQLAYGAFCGGLLAFLIAPIGVTGALGVGALRWSATQVLTAPLLGWGDFGLLGRPMIGLYTLVPHLVFALTAAWLIRQEELGHVPSFAHLPHLPHLHLAHVPARIRRALHLRAHR
jgi:hypothetical protein